MCYLSRVPAAEHFGSRDSPEQTSWPPLVLLPGTLCDGQVFTPMLKRLRSDAPGLVTHVLRTDCYSTVSEAMTGVLLQAPQRFALLGFSLGGIIALHVAAQAPGRVLGLALLDSTALPVPEKQHTTRREVADGARTLGLRALVEQHLWPDYVALSRQEDTALREQIQQMASSLGIDVLQRQTELALTRPDARCLLASLAMPALVLAGEEDRLCPLAGQRDLAAALQNGKLVIVPGAGHFALLEKPDTVAAHVAAWFHTLARP